MLNDASFQQQSAILKQTVWQASSRLPANPKYNLFGNDMSEFRRQKNDANVCCTIKSVAFPNGEILATAYKSPALGEPLPGAINEVPFLVLIKPNGEIVEFADVQLPSVQINGENVAVHNYTVEQHRGRRISGI